MFRKILLMGFFLICSLQGEVPKETYKYQLSVGTIFQNDGRFLKEWIEYHRLLGVDHFYLYDNLSTDDYLTVLEPYINQGIIDLIDWPYTDPAWVNWKKIQVACYNDCLLKAKNETLWLAIIDTDEFIFPVQEATIPDFLAKYDKFAGVVINWQQYGTSNLYEIPEGQLMIEALIMKAKEDFTDNYQFKTILKPEHTKKCVSAHSFIYNARWYAVNSDGVAYPKIQDSDHKLKTINIDKIRINHYWTRDERFFEEDKIPRHLRINRDAVRARERAKHMNAVEDRCMDKYVEELKYKLQNE